MLRALAGVDPRDSTCSARPVPDYERALTGDVKGLRIGVPKEYFVEGMEPEVESVRARGARAILQKLGARTVEISLPHTSYAVAAYYLVATAEASANLARYDGIRYGLRVARATTISSCMTIARARRASAPRSSGASCSAPSRSRPATTTPTI